MPSCRWCFRVVGTLYYTLPVVGNVSRLCSPITHSSPRDALVAYSISEGAGSGGGKAGAKSNAVRKPCGLAAFGMQKGEGERPMGEGSSSGQRRRGREEKYAKLLLCT